MKSEQKAQDKAVAAVVAAVIMVAILSYISAQISPFGIPQPNAFPPDLTTTVVGAKKQTLLYENFIMEDPVSVENIVSISRVIEVNGRIASGSLIVEAKPTNAGFDSTRRHSVYFYIDNGTTGGHLGVTMKKGLVDEGYFTIQKDKSSFYKSFELSQVFVSKSPNGKSTLDVLSILNKGGKHFIGAFCTTGKYCELTKLVIEYECEKDQDCSIELIK